MTAAQQRDWIDLIPALGMVGGSALALMLAATIDALDGFAPTMVGGAAIGFLVGLAVQRRQHRSEIPPEPTYPEHAGARSGFPWRRHVTIATVSLAFVNAAVFVLQLVDDGVREGLALPADAGEVLERPWTVFTVTFLHDHPLHLALMLALLVVFGTALEQVTSPSSVLVVYLAAGGAGSVAAVVAAGLLDGEPGVGSSAAVFGLVAAFAVLQPIDRLAGGRSTHWLLAISVANLALAATMPLGSVAHLTGVGVGLLTGEAQRARWVPSRR